MWAVSALFNKYIDLFYFMAIISNNDEMSKKRRNKTVYFGIYGQKKTTGYIYFVFFSQNIK